MVSNQNETNGTSARQQQDRSLSNLLCCKMFSKLKLEIFKIGIVSCFSDWNSCGKNVSHIVIRMKILIRKATKGHLNSEWIYEDIDFPKILTKYHKGFCPENFYRLGEEV